MHAHGSHGNARGTKGAPGQDAAIHGARWDVVHGGYFSDAAVAEPLLEKIEEAVARTRPAVVVDLGGGTGFLLCQLAVRGACGGIRLVNLDSSNDQLAAVHSRAVECVRASIDRFIRADVAAENACVVWIMRSALHYFGEQGLLPVLEHLRRQAKEGEVFVHQTACFEHEREARCLNTLYRGMHTGKWYPTAGYLRRMLGKAGWRVGEMSAAPALPLTDHELARRYGMTEEAMACIRADLERQFGGIAGVLESSPNQFCACLHYRIAVCTAVQPGR